MRLSENAQLPFDKPFDKLTVLSKVEGLTVLSKVEGLTALSKVEGLTALSKADPSTSLRVDAEPFGLELTAERQCRSIEGLRYPCPPPC
jgi:hypothetical protein